ncbi:hypothetical protein [Aliarcobacter cryaerophilus]|uniref:hypothetical protein n=1 Tax=Aliarcobacter cryaerophilus TaxID=28198 RepID=UPI0021B5534B|nr:hypothetical protein [Aliarcobacter cryaerophilus]MCT7492336.1 hypothetical protein [Aliarcobacter cryaerophilus]MCT7517097.1 hypothetical protein [Aliarcobacter cryaerophilus]
MATTMQKDVLIEFISATMIDIRNITSPTSSKDKTQLKLMRSAVYSLPCLKINYNEYIERIEKIRLRYGISN